MLHYRFGIQQVRKDSKVLGKLFIEDLMHAYLYMILLRVSTHYDDHMDIINSTKYLFTMICFNISNLEDSLQNLDTWISTFTNNAGVEKENFAFFLVGNKSDLIEQKQVTSKQIESLTSKNSIKEDRSHVTSAETGTGIEEVFGQ